MHRTTTTRVVTPSAGRARGALASTAHPGEPGAGPAGCTSRPTNSCPACAGWQFRRSHGLSAGYNVLSATCQRRRCGALCWVVYHVAGDTDHGYRQRVVGVVPQLAGVLDRGRVSRALATLAELRDDAALLDDLAMRLLAVAEAA
jgi:hypothetical protein